MTHTHLPEGTHQIVESLPLIRPDKLLEWNKAIESTFNAIQVERQRLGELPVLSLTSEQHDYKATLSETVSALLVAMEELQDGYAWHTD